MLKCVIREKVRVCVCVCYLEQAMLVTVLAQPYSTARGDLHLRGVYHPLVNPAKSKSKENVGC